MKLQAKSLMTKIETLRAELETCSTRAMRKCVEETLEDARRQLREVMG